MKLEKINFLRGRDITATLSSCNEAPVSNFPHLDMHAYYKLLITENKNPSCDLRMIIRHHLKQNIQNEPVKNSNAILVNNLINESLEHTIAANCLFVEASPWCRCGI